MPKSKKSRKSKREKKKTKRNGDKRQATVINNALTSPTHYLSRTMRQSANRLTTNNQKDKRPDRTRRHYRAQEESRKNARRQKCSILIGWKRKWKSTCSKRIANSVFRKQTQNKKKIDSRLWKRFSAFIRNCQNFRLFVFLLVRNDQNVFGWFICLCHPMAGKATLQFCPFRSSVVSLFIISSRFAHIQRRPDDFNLTKSSGELISSDEKCDNWMHFLFAQRTPFSVSSR